MIPSMPIKKSQKALSEKCAQKQGVPPPLPVVKPTKRSKIGKSHPYPLLTPLERPPKTNKISLTP